MIRFSLKLLLGHLFRECTEKISKKRDFDFPYEGWLRASNPQKSRPQRLVRPEENATGGSHSSHDDIDETLAHTKTAGPGSETEVELSALGVGLGHNEIRIGDGQLADGDPQINLQVLEATACVEVTELVAAPHFLCNSARSGGKNHLGKPFVIRNYF
ncbi:hypothetical protein ACOSQ3_023494 [Xanthoceras sorbifolium]